MSRNMSYAKWTDADGELDPRYRHLSYILFRASGEAPAILGARCPDMNRFAVGRSLTDSLNLDGEALSFLASPGDERLLVIHTDVGVGVLDKRYVRHGGVGVYWHIHGDPEGLGRLINHNVLSEGAQGGYAVSYSVVALKKRIRADDIPLYGLLTDVWNCLSTPPGAWGAGDEDGCLYAEELARIMGKMADFVGCSLVCDDEERTVTRVRCRRPVWLELCLLCLMTEAATFSADGTLHYRLSSLGDQNGEGLALQMHYFVPDIDGPASLTSASHRYLEQVGELHGMEFRGQLVVPRRGERQRGVLPRMRFNLEWLRDPTVLVSSDLKAEPELEGDASQCDTSQGDTSQILQ